MKAFQKFLAIAFLVFGTPFAYAEPAPNLTFSIPGKCTQFMVQDSDFKGCDGHVTLTVSTTAERSIYLAQATLNDGRFVTVEFMTTLSKNVSDTDFLTGVAAITLMFKGHSPELIPAVGICEQTGRRQIDEFQAIHCVAIDQQHKVYRLNFIRNQNGDRIQQVSGVPAAATSSNMPDHASYLGKWYSANGNEKECKKGAGEGSDLIIFKKGEYIAGTTDAFECKIRKTKPYQHPRLSKKGMSGLKLLLLCEGEGETSKSTEYIVWDNENLLHFQRGLYAKPERYRRCPDNSKPQPSQPSTSQGKPSASSNGQTSGANLPPVCRGRSCSYGKIQNVELVLTLKNGTIKQFDISYFECATKGDGGDCQNAKPTFSKFEKSYAFCSTASPSLLFASGNAKSKYNAVYFDFTRPMSSADTYSSWQYLLVCNGDPQADPTSLGYQKPSSKERQTIFNSVDDFIAYLKGMTSPSQQFDFRRNYLK